LLLSSPVSIARKDYSSTSLFLFSGRNQKKQHDKSSNDGTNENSIVNNNNNTNDNNNNNNVNEIGTSTTDTNSVTVLEINAERIKIGPLRFLINIH
jgi:hypothetical protein